MRSSPASRKVANAESLTIAQKVGRLASAISTCAPPMDDPIA